MAYNQNGEYSNFLKVILKLFAEDDYTQNLMDLKRIQLRLKHSAKNLFVRCFVLTATFYILISTCGCIEKKPIVYNELTMRVARGNSPRSMAVLPFKNNTSEDKIDELVRVSFYSHFSARPYRDIELYMIDKVIVNKKTINGEFIPASYLNQWGRLLGCDALIVGEVTEFQRLFLGIYSQIKLSAHIAIWDTKTGQKIWDDQHVVRSHEGGVPFHLAEVPLIAIKSGLNLLEKEKVRAADELCRYLAARIPAPTEVTNDKTTLPGYTFELQAGSFIDEERADSLLEELREKGYPAFIQRKEKEDGLWNRVLLGPYEDRKEAVETKSKIQKDLNIDSFIVKKMLDYPKD